MTNISPAAAFMAAAVLVAAPAVGQERVISLTPVESAQWDVAGHAGWLASDKTTIGVEWDDWYNAFSGGVSVGHYLTPHFKTEVHAAIAGEGRVYSEDRTPLTEPVPVFRAREHYFRTASMGAGLSYQFFENQRFHPFVGGGLDVLREHHRVRIPQQFVTTVPPTREAPPVPAAPFLVIPEINLPPEVSYAARPFVTAGFKWYVAERMFLRAAIQASFSHGGTTHLVWVGGIGGDL